MPENRHEHLINYHASVMRYEMNPNVFIPRKVKERDRLYAYAEYKLKKDKIERFSIRSIIFLILALGILLGLGLGLGLTLGKSDSTGSD